MKNRWKRGAGIFVCALATILYLGNSAEAAKRHQDYTREEIYEAIEQALEWKREDLGIEEGTPLLDSGLLELAGEQQGDGYPLCMARLGAEDDYLSYQAAVTWNVEERYQTPDKLSRTDATEWHRISLAMLASGEDPTDIGENHIDLIADGIYDRGKTAALDTQGAEGAAWGLITLDSMRYQVPEKAGYTRDDILIMLLGHQMPDGGFGTAKKVSDAPTTALALTALAPYYNSDELYHYTIESTGQMGSKSVHQVIDESLECLKGLAVGDTESVAKTITALSALGINLTEDERFIDRRHTLLDELMDHQTEEGGFAQSDGESEEPDSVSTEQALRALISYARYQDGLRSFYDFREEQPSKLRKQIQKLNGDIQKLQKAEITMESVDKLYREYLQLPASERCYVYEFHILKENMADFGIEDDSEYLSENMEINTSGAAKIVDIQNPEQVRETEVTFTKKDERKLRTLLEQVTVDEKSAIRKALYQISNTKKDYAALSEELKKGLAEIEKREQEILSLNEMIQSHLYPFDQIKMGDKALLEDIIERCQSFSDGEKEQITYYQEVVKADQKLQEEMQSLTITGLISAVVLFLIVLVIIFARIRKKKKERENQLNQK